MYSKKHNMGYFYNAFTLMVREFAGGATIQSLSDRTTIYYDDATRGETIHLGYSDMMKYLRDDVKDKVYSLSLLDDLIIVYILPMLYPNLELVGQELGFDRKQIKDMMYKLVYCEIGDVVPNKVKPDAPNGKYGYSTIKRTLDTINKIGLYADKLVGRVSLPNAGDTYADIVVFSMIELMYGMSVTPAVMDLESSEHYENFMKFDGSSFQKSIAQPPLPPSVDVAIEGYENILEMMIIIDSEEKSKHLPTGDIKLC
ncbi:MAG: hypothetical protein ACRC92_25960 [Peptostreptococcaceae bacterium]